MATKQNYWETWQKLIEVAAKFQEILPDAILVGWSGTSVHLRHRFSFDADHINVVNHNQADGRWFHSEAYPLKDQAGNVRQVLESVIDITDHKQAEEASENERFFLSTIIDNIQEAIITCNNEGKLIRFNEFARRLHGQPEQAIRPEQWTEYYDLYRSDGITPLPMEEIPLFCALQGKQFQNVEIVVAPKHTNPKYLLCKGQPLVDDQNTRIGALVSMFDITEHRQAQEAMQESELKFRILFEDTLNPVLVVDTDGRYVQANEAALQFLECTGSELFSKYVWDWAPPGTLEQQKIEHSPFISRRIIETDY